MLRIDTHHHMIPPDYRKALQQAGIDESGGRAVPEWSPERSLRTMAELDVDTAILSVSTPGTAFLPNAADAAALARDLNDSPSAGAGRVTVARLAVRVPRHGPAAAPRRVRGRERSARSRRPQRRRGGAAGEQATGHDLGRAPGRTSCGPRSTRARRSCSSIRHDLPGPAVPGTPRRSPPTSCWTRSLRGIPAGAQRHPAAGIRTSASFSSHAGGSVPYASHRLAVARSWATPGASPADSLEPT